MSSSSFSTNLGLPATPPTNDSELYTQLMLVYQAINALGAGAKSAANNTISLTAAEDIPAGSFVNIYNNQLRIADAANSSGAGLIRQIIYGLNGSNVAITYTYLPSIPFHCLLGVDDRPVHGFTSSLIANNTNGTILLAPAVIKFSSPLLTSGSSYYLSAYGYTSTTAQGKIYAGPPAGKGNGFIRQYIGIAISTTELFFNPDVDAFYW